jgi:hypothetical protein
LPRCSACRFGRRKIGAKKQAKSNPPQSPRLTPSREQIRRFNELQKKKQQ